MNELQKQILDSSKAWTKSKGSVTSVMNLVEFIESIQYFTNHDGRHKWLYRGEPFLYEQPCTPTLYRQHTSFSKYHTNKNITHEEIEAIKTCQSKYDRNKIKDRYLEAFLPLIHTEDVNWLPLARHFGFSTRLLDVTVNPLVALYFACSELHQGEIDENNDAFVYVFQSDSFRPVNSRNTQQRTPSDYPPIPISYLDLYDVDSQFTSNNFDELPYLFESSIPQERLQAQAGRFIFWKSLESDLLLKKQQIIPIRINASKKSIILKELSVLGITYETLFPSAIKPIATGTVVYQ